ncbi:MAG: NADH-quinone oxidoreductase subunit NuoE [Pseudomonadota bacterium]|nr:MAG: NADH-quinone oxidoreductase subunit NuoE [Pseudomonadota bacterium]
MSSQSKSKEPRIGLLTPASLNEIDQWIDKYPAEQRQSAVMAALRVAQEQNGGWLTSDLMDAVAEYLQMPAIAVYEVATFYSMYELRPVGKTKLCLCTNISCQLRGSEEIVAHLKQRLGVEMGGTTEDGKITLKEVECLGACVNAPVMQVGREYHENLTPESIDAFLDGLE